MRVWLGEYVNICVQGVSFLPRLRLLCYSQVYYITILLLALHWTWVTRCDVIRLIVTSFAAGDSRTPKTLLAHTHTTDICSHLHCIIIIKLCKRVWNVLEVHKNVAVAISIAAASTFDNFCCGFLSFWATINYKQPFRSFLYLKIEIINLLRRFWSAPQIPVVH